MFWAQGHLADSNGASTSPQGSFAPILTFVDAHQTSHDDKVIIMHVAELMNDHDLGLTKSTKCIIVIPKPMICYSKVEECDQPKQNMIHSPWNGKYVAHVERLLKRRPIRPIEKGRDQG
jgi:hypothetical protein